MSDRQYTDDDAPELLKNILVVYTPEQIRALPDSAGLVVSKTRLINTQQMIGCYFQIHQKAALESSPSITTDDQKIAALLGTGSNAQAIETIDSEKIEVMLQRARDSLKLECHYFFSEADINDPENQKAHALAALLERGIKNNPLLLAEAESNAVRIMDSEGTVSSPPGRNRGDDA